MQDRYLLKRMRHGDKDALRLIYEKYRDDLFTVAVSLLRDIPSAEDCLQDIFVRLVENSAAFNIRTNLKSYLISCIANRARDHLRKKAVTLDCPIEQISCLSVADNPVDNAITREQSSRLLTALSQLPYEQREVAVLYTQGRLKFKEIAKLQNISIRTAQSRYRYAIEKLRAILQKESAHELTK